MVRATLNREVTAGGRRHGLCHEHWRRRGRVQGRDRAM